MKYLFSIILIGAIYILPAFAQGTADLTTEEWREFLSGDVVRTKTAVRTKGSPYLGPDWSKGHVLLNKRAKSETLFLRYNMEKNEVEFLRDEKIYVMDSKKISGFTILTRDGQINFRNNFNIKSDEINKTTLLRVVYGGPTKLLAHHSASLKEDLAAYGMASQLNEYVRGVDYYILSGTDHTFHEVALKRTAIIKLFNDKKTEVDEYARNKGLNFEEEPDLVKIISHYDQLVSGSE